ncbi:hypothetical protein VTK73DRAFT_2058 [Phialemonium thermophilum]|uniref:Glutamate--tRNA ligase n=1 Tax=Phialemonium thermophilum TaxID=223376 RepID=A0ABR3X6A6_9PEZI
MALSEAESDERARAGQPYAVRFKSSKEPVAVHDLVYRRFKKAEPEEDFIIRKRDGFPTYHFANVVDDHAMEVTHVVRGAEWLISTPKHVELYNAFGWQPPQFVHVGLLVNSERQKLSKRHPGVDLSWYKNEGILPPALLNFAVLLGWHQGHAKDIMTLPEMIDNFSLKFTRGDIIVNMGKLPYFQKQHTKRLLAEEPPNMDLLTAHFIRPIEGIIKSMEEARLAKRSYSGFDVSLLGDMVAQLESEPAGPQHRVLKALKANKPSISTLEDFVKDNKYLFWAVPQQVLKARLEGLHLRDSSLEEGSGKREATLEEVMAFFKRKFERFAGIWASQDLTPAIKQAAASVTFVDTETGRKMESGGYKLLRWSLLGGDSGPGLGDVMEILGRDETLRRVEYSRKTADTWAERAS